MSEAQNPHLWKDRQALGYCRRCKKAFEESTKICPRCDKKDQMGTLRQIPERFREQAERRAIEDAKARVRANNGLR